MPRDHCVFCTADRHLAFVFLVLLAMLSRNCRSTQFTGVSGVWKCIYLRMGIAVIPYDLPLSSCMISTRCTCWHITIVAVTWTVPLTLVLQTSTSKTKNKNNQGFQSELICVSTTTFKCPTCETAFLGHAMATDDGREMTERSESDVAVVDLEIYMECSAIALLATMLTQRFRTQVGKKKHCNNFKQFAWFWWLIAGKKKRLIYPKDFGAPTLPKTDGSVWFLWGPSWLGSGYRNPGDDKSSTCV